MQLVSFSDWLIFYEKGGWNMPSKLQFYSEFAERTARQITGSYRSWTAFLATAGRLYKYPYNEQLMIYAQRPNATACAEYDFWKDRMGRYA